MFIVGWVGYAKTWVQPFGEERAMTSEERIGKVDDLFVDESDSEEYIGVKLGLFGTKSTLIPMDIVRVNEADKAIEVSDSKDHVQDAPTFGDDDEVTADYEDRIRSHFGLESVGTSSSGSGYGAYSGAGTTSGTDYDSDESTARSSGTSAGYTDDEESREYGTTEAHDDRADDESSFVDTEYGERTDSSTATSERSESSSGASAGTSGGSTESFGGSTGDQESGGTPASRRTEETETVEEGGRTKVRRRIVREEIVEEDPGS
jgi:hypothetical protein